MKKLLLSLSVFVALQQYSYSTIGNLFSSAVATPVVAATALAGATSTAAVTLVDKLKNENTSKKEKIALGTAIVLGLSAAGYVTVEAVKAIIEAYNKAK